MQACGATAATTVALGLGSNQGPSQEILCETVRRLAAALGPLRVAPPFRTAAFGRPLQPPYLNTAALGATCLDPEAVLAIAKLLEYRAGRRPGVRFAPRPLDIDLLLYGDALRVFPELTLPHPRLRERRFVLAPLAALAPDLRVPPDGATVASLLARVGQEADVEELAWSVDALG